MYFNTCIQQCILNGPEHLYESETAKVKIFYRLITHTFCWPYAGKNSCRAFSDEKYRFSDWLRMIKK